jgi:hypothetical protein
MTVKKEGLFQALGVAVYCLLIGLFMGNGNQIVGDLALPLGPVLVLLLFSTSALICGTIVFYYPYKLFVAKKTKEAMEVVISTAAFLFIFLLIFLGGVVIFR